MAGFTVTGTITKIGKTQEVGDNGFTKRAILIETTDQYDNTIYAELVKDKCALLDNYKVGQQVTLDINVRCNEYNGRYYTNLQAWRINKADAQQQASANDLVPQGAEEDTDLPF